MVSFELNLKFQPKVQKKVTFSGPLGRKKNIDFQPHHAFWYEIPAI